MSIDKTVKSDRVELNTPLWFGIHKGKTPNSIIRSLDLSAIRYLVWLREQRNEKNFPRFMFSSSLHHVVDQMIRTNEALSDCVQRFDATAYAIWLAESKLLREKVKKIKLEKAQRAKEELLIREQAQQAKHEELKLKAQELAIKLKMEREFEANQEAIRMEAYSESWGAW